MSTIADMRAANEAHESLGEYIPLAKEYLELRDAIFGYADDLGIGEEVRDFYHGAQFGQKAGAVMGAGAAALLGGGALAAAYSGAMAAGIAVGMAAGGLIGGAIALVGGLFGDDDDEGQKEAERKARKAAKAKARADWEAWILKPLTFENMVADQRRYADLMAAQPQTQANKILHDLQTGAISSPASPEEIEKARKYTTLYQKLRAGLNPWQRAVFLVDADRGRLREALASSWVALKTPQNDATRAKIQARLAQLDKQSLSLAIQRTAIARKVAVKSGGGGWTALALAALVLKLFWR